MKLGIYSTYPPRNSINFLARCANFCKPLKKIQKFVRPNRSPRQQWPPRRTKNGELSIVFFSPANRSDGPDSENRVSDQDIGSPGSPVSSGLQVPGEPGHCRARTRPPWWPSRGVFPSKCPSIAPAEMSNTLRWWFGPLEDNKWGGCLLDPKKIKARTFPTGFCTQNFLGRGESLCRHPLIVALSLGHSDTTRFRPWLPIEERKSFGSRRKNSKSCSDDWHRWRFLSAVRHFGTHFAESFRMSKSSWMMDPTRSCEISSCSAINLTEIRRSYKFNSWIWSIISVVVTVLGRPGRGASQVENHHV